MALAPKRRRMSEGFFAVFGISPPRRDQVSIPYQDVCCHPAHPCWPRGFKVVRGVPVDQHTREENMIIYAGITSHIAPIRGRQDNIYQGNPADVVLAHITDLSRKVDTKTIKAPAYTTEKQVFHTDAGDIITLFALEEAAKGGQSYLSRSWHVYNELARTRPDLIRTLAEPWVTEQGENPVSRPLLYHQPGRTILPSA
ncbi:hypothetical protein BDV06DRAFT_196974 [Aspergillus oleicola]